MPHQIGHVAGKRVQIAEAFRHDMFDTPRLRGLVPFRLRRDGNDLFGSEELNIQRMEGAVELAVAVKQDDVETVLPLVIDEIIDRLKGREKRDIEIVWSEVRLDPEERPEDFAGRFQVIFQHKNTEQQGRALCQPLRPRSDVLRTKCLGMSRFAFCSSALMERSRHLLPTHKQKSTPMEF